MTKPCTIKYFHRSTHRFSQQPPNSFALYGRRPQSWVLTCELYILHEEPKLRSEHLGCGIGCNAILAEAVALVDPRHPSGPKTAPRETACLVKGRPRRSSQSSSKLLYAAGASILLGLSRTPQVVLTSAQERTLMINRVLNSQVGLNPPGPRVHGRSYRDAADYG